MTDRLAALRRLLEKNPGDARAHFGLAAELEKQQAWEDVVTHLRAYLDLTDDEGNAWGRLGRALLQLGRTAEALAAYQRGIIEARGHGHPSMAVEFEERVEEIQPGD